LIDECDLKPNDDQGNIGWTVSLIYCH